MEINQIIERMNNYKIKAAIDVRTLMEGIKGNSFLGEWLPLESIIFPPFPVHREPNWNLIVLISGPDSNGKVHPPWGCIEWRLPIGRIAQTIDLRLLQETKRLREHMKPFSWPPNNLVQLNNQHTVLYKHLDDLIRHDSTVEISDTLKGLYSLLLPEEIYPIFWLLAPYSKTWLKSEIMSKFRASFKERMHSPENKPKHRTNRSQTESKSTDHKLSVNLPIAPVAPVSKSRCKKEAIHISDILNKCVSLVTDANEPYLADELRHIEIKLKQKTFRIAVVGEFSRGKSTLINRILGRDLLPVHPVPKTGPLTSIVYGASECVSHYEEDHQWCKPTPLPEFDWTNVESRNGDIQNKKLSKVRIFANHPWLEEMELEFIDTPGLTELNENQAKELFQFLLHCDCTIITLSPPGTVSLTEKALLERTLAERKFNEKIVAATKLDTVDEDQRSSFVEDIVRRVQKIDENAFILPVLYGNGNENDATMEPLRRKIAEIVTDSERHIWQEKQSLQNISNVVGRLQALSERRLKTITLDSETVQHEKRKMEWEIEEKKTEWEALKIDFEERRKIMSKKLIECFQAARSEIVKELTHSLENSGNPVKWWRSSLPYIFQTRSKTVANSFQRDFFHHIPKDYSWLLREVKIKFGVNISSSVPEITHYVAEDIELPNLDLADHQKQRLYYLLGAGAAGILSYTLLFPFVGPLGLLISLGSGLITNEFLNKRTEEQRKILLEELDGVVEEALNDISKLIDERIYELYLKISDTLEREKGAWFQTHMAELNVTDKPIEPESLKIIVERCENLRKEIVQYQER